MDRLRLSRRALAQRLAQHQLAIRHHRHLRISQGLVLLLPVVVDRKPVLHLFPHWNWPGMEGKKIAVWVHSNLDKVELFLNGQSLGAKEMKKDSHLAWNVAYAPGVIEARGFKDGELVLDRPARNHRRAAALAMYADRSRHRSPMAKMWPCSPSRCAMRRAASCPSPTIESRSRSLAGTLIGVGNGDPTDHDRQGLLTQGVQRQVHGHRAIHQVHDIITVEATSPGLTPAR